MPIQMNMTTASLVAATALACALAVYSQTLAFEAASIRQSRSAASEGDVLFLPGGGFNAQNETVLELIRQAYNIEPFRMAGGPDWIRTDRYDIRARAAANVTVDETRLMLRNLLEERFQLRARMELREMPIFELVLSQRGRMSGPQLHPASAETCVDRGPQPINVPRDALPSCGRLLTNPGRMSGRRVPLDLLATRLSSIVGRTVVNRTDRAGMFDVDLSWAPESGSIALQQERPGIFTALDEQLGLRLEPSQAPVDVLAIERIERPTQN
jgi:uncharacterized protein (TIGR03435 family)